MQNSKNKLTYALGSPCSLIQGYTCPKMYPHLLRECAKAVYGSRVDDYTVKYFVSL